MGTSTAVRWVGTGLALLLAACSGTGTARPAGPSSPSSPSPSSSVSTFGSPARTGTLAATTTCRVPARLRGQDLERLPVSDKVIALTFDAGANAAGLPSIMRTLRERRVRATFFLTGRFVRTFPQKSTRIANRHLVGNHTDTHPDLTTLTPRQVRVEIRRAQRTIRTVTGEDPRRFFRFPFGARTSREIGIANELCYVPFRWTVDTLGWKGTSGGQSVSTVVQRVRQTARPGGIVLMHVGSHPTDGSTLDADALPRVVRMLRRDGYRLVRLSYVMSAQP